MSLCRVLLDAKNVHFRASYLTGKSGIVNTLILTQTITDISGFVIPHADRGETHTYLVYCTDTCKDIRAKLTTERGDADLMAE
jgi:hypothetical protein